MKVFSSYLYSAFLLLGACTAAPQSEVKVLIGPASESVVSSGANDAFAPRSATGLVSSGFCYVLNVTAADLNVEGTTETSTSCTQGPRALGKNFGPFAYGEETTLKVPAGSDRRFDLLGFKIPASTRQDCRGEFSVKVVDSETGGKKVETLYDGIEVGANKLPLDPMRLSYLFARTSGVTLQPGAQTLTLEPVAWSEQDLGQGLYNYPTIYGCPKPDDSGVGPEKISLSWSYFVQPGVLAIVRGTTAAVQIQLTDVDGNPVSGILPGRLTLSGLMGIGSAASFADLGNGLYQAIVSIAGGAALQSRSLIAQIDGQNFVSPARTLTVLSSAPGVDTAVSTVSLVQSSVEAGDDLFVTVNLRDQFNQPLLGRSPQIRVEVGGVSDSTFGVTGSWTDNGDGSYTTLYRALKEGLHYFYVDVDAVTLVQVPILTVAPGIADWISISGLSDPVQSEMSGALNVLTKKNGYLIDAIVPDILVTPIEASTAQLTTPMWLNAAVGVSTYTYQVEGRGDFQVKVGGNAGNVYSNTLTSRAILQTGYDPLTPDWNPIEAQYDLAVIGHTAIWTGTEMIVWGGVNTLKTPSSLDDVAFQGLRYRPSDDSWHTVSAPPIAFRKDHTAVWTGSDMIVWGGISIDDTTYYADGAAYNPVANTWVTLDPGFAPPLRAQHTAVWTGTKMLIWGGFNGSSYLNDGYVYNPAASPGSNWAQTGATNEPTARVAKAVWTGTEMVVFGGSNSVSPQDDGGAYDPANDTWNTTPLASMATPRALHSLVWTGTKILSIGGLDASSTALGSSEIYDVGTNLWTAGSAYPLGEVFNHTAIRADGTNYVLVWGGQDSGSVATNLGHVYDLSTNTWTWSINASSGVPSLRLGHTAIWTQGAGTRMIVWGGVAP